MQTLVKTLVVFILFSIHAKAQTSAPEPPKPPKVYSGTHSSSISVSKTDEDYRIKASFHKSRFAILKDYLLSELGEDGLTSKGKTYVWSHGSDSFECKLTSTSLRLNMDYSSNNKTFVEHVERIGKNIKYKISGNSPNDNIKDAEKELAEAQRNLEEAKAKLNSIKKN
ncbi:hypothetical protein EYD45_15505 [Hyunsoonleella flava]|uniref:DUF4468 domain-containing protein n=1 Tax=Hyunsoonleella flava TaxID=2527939 RepID=A0A4V2J9S1_9FLAO|nr:hypothetical protein [Hyunsoonleella flava]TBM99363.1 hypothetical protein EYD45_15505 [Hyunsoonleella flava]